MSPETSSQVSHDPPHRNCSICDRTRITELEDENVILRRLLAHTRGLLSEVADYLNDCDEERTPVDA